MAGLEVVRTLNDLGYETEAPIEIVAWTNEEGSRFSPAMVGSGVFAGVFDLAYGLERPDNVTGVTLGAELSRIGFAGTAAGRRPPGRGLFRGAYRAGADPRSRGKSRSASSPARRASAGTRSRSPARRRMPGRRRCRGGATRWSAPRG